MNDKIFVQQVSLDISFMTYITEYPMN